MARVACSSATVSGAAPFFRTYRLGWGLVFNVSAVSARDDKVYAIKRLLAPHTKRCPGVRLRVYYKTRALQGVQ